MDMINFQHPVTSNHNQSPNQSLLTLCTPGLRLALQPSLLLQLSRILDTKSMLEDLTNILKSHALDLRIAKVNCDPAEEADCGIETEGS